MTATYQVATPTDALVWSQEMLATAITGHPYLDHVAACCVLNPTGSGRIVKMREVAISPIAERAATVQTQLQVIRTTAMTGGTAVTPTPMDSANTALPSQVTAVSYPATVTTSGTTLARVAIVPLQNTVRALGWMAAARGDGKFDTGRLYGWQRHSDVQPITLREGQGIALSTGDAAFSPMQVNWSITFTVAATGATWVASGFGVTGVLPVAAILNASGSGVVLNVMSISVWEKGEDAPPMWSVEYVDVADIGSSSGVALTPVALDSSNTLGGIVAYTNAAVKSAGAKHGAVIVTPRKVGVVSAAPGRGPGLASLDLAGIKPVYLYRAMHNDRVMVVREGEGVAVLQRNTGAIGRHEITMQFTVEEAASGGAGVQSVVRAFA